MGIRDLLQRAWSGSNRQGGGDWVFVFIVAALAAAMGAFIWVGHQDSDKGLYVLAPEQVVLGSIVFLLGVAAVVAILGRLELTNDNQALGLPEGSIRALLALILLIIFVIFGNIIYGQTQQQVPTRSDFTGLTAKQVEDLPGHVVEQSPQRGLGGGPGGGPRLLDGVYVEEKPNPAARELGQQIVTALLTLLTAISAFYFGANPPTTRRRRRGGQGRTRRIEQRNQDQQNDEPEPQVKP